MDCDLVSRGTGTPVSKGFDPQEVIELIQAALQSDKLVALELSEINPLLDDKGNRMAEVVFEIIEEIFKI
jgi:arginase